MYLLIVVGHAVGVGCVAACAIHTQCNEYKLGLEWLGIVTTVICCTLSSLWLGVYVIDMNTYTGGNCPDVWFDVWPS